MVRGASSLSSWSVSQSLMSAGCSLLRDDRISHFLALISKYQSFKVAYSFVSTHLVSTYEVVYVARSLAKARIFCLSQRFLMSSSEKRAFSRYNEKSHGEFTDPWITPLYVSTF